MSAPPQPKVSPFRDNLLEGKARLTYTSLALPARTRLSCLLTPAVGAQVALITGGGSGIGYEITRQLGERAKSSSACSSVCCSER